MVDQLSAPMADFAADDGQVYFPDGQVSVFLCRDSWLCFLGLQGKIRRKCCLWFEFRVGSVDSNRIIQYARIE